MIDPIKEPPCKTCLVVTGCKIKMCKDGYLIVEYLKTCPFVCSYITKKDGKTLGFDFYKKAEKICKIFEIKENNFVWYAHELGF